MKKIFKHTILNCLSIAAATHPKLVTFGIGLVVASVLVALVGDADTASAAYRITGKAD